MAAFGAATSRVRLGQMCTCMAYRNPAYLAKVAATIDVISGGRVEMGIGGGWYEHEWRAYGYGFPPAGERLGALRDGVEIFRQMWTKGSRPTPGSTTPVDGAIGQPRPLQGTTPAGVGRERHPDVGRRRRREGDAEDRRASMPTTPTSTAAPEGFDRKSAILEEHCKDVGRDFGSIVRSANYNVVIGETEKDVQDRLAWIEDSYRKAGLSDASIRAQAQNFRSGPAVGTPEQIVETLKGLAEAGDDLRHHQLPRGRLRHLRDGAVRVRSDPGAPGVLMVWRLADMPDQTGRVFVVTGANSGIGFEAAKALSRKGARVVMACRNLGKAEAARAEVGGDTEVRELDLGSLASIHAFAEAWEGRIDVLVNNAGIMAVPFARTVDGFESHYGTNFLGPFALTGLLLPQVTDRVVTLSSGVHRMGRIDLADPGFERRRYQRWTAYGQSKLADLMFAYELQRRLLLAGSTLRSIAAHPGYAATNLQANLGTVALTSRVDAEGRAGRRTRPAEPCRPCTRRPRRTCRVAATSDPPAGWSRPDRPASWGPRPPPATSTPSARSGTWPSG